jgi:tetratricopeptide (TPR) repeat protein
LLYVKASLLRAMTDYDGAMKLCDKLAAVQEFRDAADSQRITIYTLRKEYDKAEELISKWRQREPESTEPDYLQATVYNEKGNAGKSEEVLAGILKKHPRDPAANNDLGYMKADRGENVAESEQMIRIALQEDPESSAYLDSLGWALYKQNKIEPALVYLKRSVRLDPRIDPVVWDHLGDALARGGHTDEAQQAYEKAMEMLKSPTRTPAREDGDVAKRLTKKLEAVRQGKEVPTAGLGKGIK